MPTEPSFLTETRAAYDTVAVDYEALLRDELDRRPVERGLLVAFAELVAAGGGGTVADVGCGPGRLTALLVSLGLDVVGIDLSPAMVATARSRHPGVPFVEGSMTDLDVAAGSLAGVLAWYSVIHVPDQALPDVFAGFHRALRPGGWLLLAFQVGDERRDVTQGYGHAIALTMYRRRPDQVGTLLAAASFAVTARLVREADHDEKSPQAFLLARRPERGT